MSTLFALLVMYAWGVALVVGAAILSTLWTRQEEDDTAK